MKEINRNRKNNKGHNQRTRRITAIIVVPLILAGVFLYISSIFPVEASGKRVVMLGFDGMDYSVASEYIDQGELPNLARLRDRGIFSPLWSTTPPESPVAWSAFITGTNPGKTGIFDFLRRNPETYFPELNMTDVVEQPEFMFDTVPYKPPVLRNARQGDSFWKYAADAGVDTIGIMMPMNMPPDQAGGSRVLSGLGVPDVRRTMGTYVYYVDDLDVARRHTGSTEGTEMGGRVIEVIREGNEIETFLPGPYSPIDSEEIRAPVTMTVNPDASTAEFRILNQKPFMFIEFFSGLLISLIVCLVLWVIFARMMKGTSKGLGIAALIFVLALVVLGAMYRPTKGEYAVNLNEGEWSDWIPVKYLVTDWVGVEGFFRIYFIEADPEFQMYVTPVNIDPRGTKAAALSFPANFAPGLLNRYGNFKTYGWDSETWALNENVIDEAVYMEDLLWNWDTKADMVLDLMKKEDWTMFASVFQGTDHVSHMFWRFLDETHPMYDPALAELYGDSILTVYQRADEIVGKVMDEVLDEDDVLIVMSDHGFETWHKAVNLNRWLIDNGYLAEKHSVVGGQSSVYELFQKDTEFFKWVNWSDSKAYALGLGQIYINLEGREDQGIVTENERDALIDEIIEGLLRMRDPETGEPILIDAYRADEIYHGDNMEYSPDIVVGFAPGYRVSWQTTLGVAAEDLVEVNQKKWSGDHCSIDSSICLGVLFTTIPITVDDPNLIDLTPSILSLLGVEKPARCDGRVIFQQGNPDGSELLY